ncbi:hypothetical protein SCWH03_40130 [Streptomyces pacificus]|uniref:Uncharacterized protein n=1 Tax=Streptomyces pacificus TaxID=2705029 RepID=A0A6A0AZC0_9ACTN|nr:hypothetical protein SCWH03_40130 [Streptomyces pacificus]
MAVRRSDRALDPSGRVPVRRRSPLPGSPEHALCGAFSATGTGTGTGAQQEANGSADLRPLPAGEVLPWLRCRGHVTRHRAPRTADG